MARILVIDDSETVIRAIRAALSLDGHLVDQLYFFVDLVNVLRRQPPDLVVLDLDMPGFSGVRLGSFLREQCHSQVPVVIYSSRSRTEIDAVAQKLGRAVGVEKAGPIVTLRSAVTASLSAQRRTA